MTFEEYYNCSKNLRPFDLASNPFGFGEQKGECSDESAHMPILEYFASLCNRIVEFGFRTGSSTCAFSKGLGKSGDLISVDIVESPKVYLFKSFQMPCRWRFCVGDTSQKGLDIPSCDLLHIDTLHTFNQVKKELELYGNFARKFLTFHDTYSQGIKSLDNSSEEGINRAIDEWTLVNGFKLIYSVNFNHGLRIYERVQ